MKPIDGEQSEPDAEQKSASESEILKIVWDIPTRVFHWTLVLCFAFSWWTGSTDRMTLHKISGFTLAALLVFRIFWGLAGTTTARFSDFLRGPRQIWRYLWGGGPDRAGHNPFGGWSVMIMLLMLLTQVVLGLFSVDEYEMDSGPLYGYVSFDTGRLAAHVHALNFDALLVAISLHVIAVLIYLARGNNLILPMLTGRKRLAEGVRAPVLASRWVLIAGVLLGVAVFDGLWRLEAGRP